MDASIEHLIDTLPLQSAPERELLSVDEEELWATALAQQVVALGAGKKAVIDEICRWLKQVLVGCELLEKVAGALAGAEQRGKRGALGEIDSLLSARYRQQRGAFMTPPAAAEALVALIGELPDGPVLDPACGHGQLLLAARARWPQRELVGVELHPGLAAAAALRLWQFDRGSPGEGRGAVRIVVGDGLSAVKEPCFAAVISNPPYVGEKGRAEFFETLRLRHRDLAELFSPRMDLMYLFIGRATGLVFEGGYNAWLTPPYWLTADGATALREHLGRTMTAETFVQLNESRLFSATPGTEHLMATLRRGQHQEGPGRWWKGSLKEFAGGLRGATPLAEGVLSAEGWHPFTPAPVVQWWRGLQEKGTPFEELGRDFQGFVSGADRVTARHLECLRNAEKGEPIFLAEGQPLPESWERAPEGLVLPVLRSRQLQKNQVIRHLDTDAFALYVDDEAVERFGEEILEELLGRFRPVLEKRREVEQGKMAWCRLHWPRARELMRGPKLVVPRRAKAPCFALDLSGSVVSSDCTFVVAPAEVADKARYLCALMLLLNDPQSERCLRYFGKRKGEQLEFYATPLRRLRLGARRHQGTLVLEEAFFNAAQRRAFWERVESLLVEAAS